MAKLCLKKTSKRIACNKRYKIEKKVREHNRKKRRAAKKDPFFKGRSKDRKLIHVPNICPFKEDILKEAAQAKARKEEERVQARERVRQEREEARGASSRGGVESLATEAAARQRAHDARQPGDELEQKHNLAGALKTYYREFKKVVDAADVLLEVVDARDPLGTRCLEVEQAVLDAPGNKRLVIVVNKADLVSRENLDAWLRYLRRSFPATAMKASTQKQKRSLASRKFQPNEAVSGSGSVGANLLLSLLANYCRNKGIKTSITVGVVGMPNVGKSSVINSLRRSRVCGVGAVPGVTRAMQAVQLDSNIRLLDSPGVVLSRATPGQAALKNVLDVCGVKDPAGPALAILRRASKEQLLAMYDIPDFSQPEHFLALLAKRYGKQKKGGVPDTDMAARMLINDWNRGKIKYHTVPPEDTQQDTHVSAEIVREMAAEFDLEAFVGTEDGELQALQAEDTDISVLLPSGAERQDDALGESVAVTTGQRAKKLRWRKEGDEREKPDPQANLAGNQKLNQVKRVQFKKLKKLRAKNERKTDQLADVLDSFCFQSSGDSAQASTSDAYDFDMALAD